MHHRLTLAACCTAALAACTYGPPAFDLDTYAYHDASVDRAAPRDVSPRDVAADAAPRGVPTILPSPPRAPPPIAGGTLLVTRDDRHAVAADPDHDVVAVVDLDGARAAAYVALTPGDEPGRLVEDDRGRVYVALRRAGAVATVDLARGAVVARTPVCPAPRGLAWDDDARALHVACAGGELVTLREGAAPVKRALEVDLRDVVAVGGSVWATRFREASLVGVGADGERATLAPVALADVPPRPRLPFVAWRAVRVGDDVAVLHQAASDLSLGATAVVGSYYGDAFSLAATVPVVPALSFARVGDEGASWQGGVALTRPGLAVDLAVRREGSALQVAVAMPGWGFTQGVEGVVVYEVARNSDDRVYVRSARPVEARGQAVAVAWSARGELVVQTRAPWAVRVRGERARDAEFALDDRRDEGHDVFHAAGRSGLACASCHPEGGDDGRVWTFSQGSVRRRTQSLRGGVADTAPFHWDGALPTMRELAHESFTRRLGGATLSDARALRLAQWIETLPSLPAPPVAEDVDLARGEALFHTPALGCATCHAGDALTDNRSRDVGTGGAFQVPSLRGLAHRAPYFHDGCAQALRGRFDDLACGGRAHRTLGALSADDRRHLVGWLLTR